MGGFDQHRDVIIFLDVDEHVSPFDVLTAMDLFPDAQILTYSNVSAEAAKTLIRDAMFPRGPEGARHTKIFIGGSDVDKASGIVEAAKAVMFPPFELAVLVDPRGAYTTASAAVAKTLAMSVRHGFGNFRDKTVSVLAGTGPVGQVAAALYAMEGARVVVSSRSLEKATAVAAKINMAQGAENVRGVEAATDEGVGEAIKDAHVVLAAGAAGTKLLSLDVLRAYGRRCRIVADVNAVPPLGVEGLKPSEEDVEFAPNVFGIGALAVGTFKNKVAARLFRQVMDASKGVFDYRAAYKAAKSMALEKLPGFSMF